MRSYALNKDNRAFVIFYGIITFRPTMMFFYSPEWEKKLYLRNDRQPLME
jgi:hypothetical protein